MTLPGRREARVHPFLLASLLCLLAVAIAAVRLPFLGHPLVDEDAYFGVLAVDNGIDRIDATQGFLIQGRLRGYTYYGAPGHPALPYHFMTRVLRGLPGGRPFQQLSVGEKSRIARIRFLATFAVGAVTGLCALQTRLRAATRPVALLSLAAAGFVFTTPLMVGGSIQPEIDGSFGVSLSLLAACCLLFHGRTMSRSRSALVASGGFLSAVGKNEWAMAMAMAATVSLAMALLRRPGHRYSRTHASWLLAGLAAGSLASFLLDPFNYWLGFHTMVNVLRRSPPWSRTFLKRLPFVWPLLAVAAASLLVAWRRRRALRRLPHGAVLPLWGGLMTVGFLLPSWPGDGFPRHFCPALAVLGLYLTTELPRVRMRRLTAFGYALLAGAGIAVNLAALAAFHDGRNLGSHPGRASATERDISDMLDRVAREEIPLVSLPFLYYRPEHDAVFRGLRQEQVRAVLHAAPGVPPWPDPVMLGPVRQQREHNQ